MRGISHVSQVASHLCIHKWKVHFPSIQNVFFNKAPIYVTFWYLTLAPSTCLTMLSIVYWPTNLLQVLLDEERVRVIGVSNFLERHLEMILEECSVIPQVNQCEFHPFNNPKMLRQFCADRNIQFEVRQ